MAFCAIRSAKAAGRTGDRLDFTLLRVPNTDRRRRAERVTLQLHVGPGDTAEPVVTIMLPGED